MRNLVEVERGRERKRMSAKSKSGTTYKKEEEKEEQREEEAALAAAFERRSEESAGTVKGTASSRSNIFCWLPPHGA